MLLIGSVVRLLWDWDGARPLVCISQTKQELLKIRDYPLNIQFQHGKHTGYTVHSDGSCSNYLNSIITHSILQYNRKSEFASEAQIECTHFYINMYR